MASMAGSQRGIWLVISHLTILLNSREVWSEQSLPTLTNSMGVEWVFWWAPCPVTYSSTVLHVHSRHTQHWPYYRWINQDSDLWRIKGEDEKHMYMTTVIREEWAGFLPKRQRRFQELKISSEMISKVSHKRNLPGKEKWYYREWLILLLKDQLA